MLVFNKLIHSSQQNRTFKDARPAMCFEERYQDPKTLPTTSLIIIFHNEAITTLIRTFVSAMRHSPPHLLKDVSLR